MPKNTLPGTGTRHVRSHVLDYFLLWGRHDLNREWRRLSISSGGWPSPLRNDGVKVRDDFFHSQVFLESGFNHLEKYESQWVSWDNNYSHILWKVIKAYKSHVPKHQPVLVTSNSTQNVAVDRWLNLHVCCYSTSCTVLMKSDKHG